MARLVRPCERRLGYRCCFAERSGESAAGSFAGWEGGFCWQADPGSPSAAGPATPEAPAPPHPVELCQPSPVEKPQRQLHAKDRLEAGRQRTGGERALHAAHAVHFCFLQHHAWSAWWRLPLQPAINVQSCPCSQCTSSHASFAHCPRALSTPVWQHMRRLLLRACFASFAAASAAATCCCFTTPAPGSSF